jgi:peptidoglycan hydrolase-like protein with peptidoglycan-binding domain
MHAKAHATRHQPERAPRPGHRLASLRRALLLGAAMLSAFGLPAAAAQAPLVVPVEAQRIKGAGGRNEAFSISLTVDGQPYRLLLDEAAGVSTLVGGDEPEVGKRSHAVRPLRTVASNGKLLLDVEVDGVTTRVPLGLDALENGPKPAAGKRSRRDATAVRAVQAELARLGLDPGPVDGVAGQRTQIAMRQFEERYGIALANSPTAVDAEIMRRVAAAPPPAAPAAAASAVAAPAAPVVAETAPAASAPVVEAPAHPSPPPGVTVTAEHAPAVAAERMPVAAAERAPVEPAAPTSHMAETAPIEPAPTTAPPALDLASYAREPYTVEAQRAVEAMATRPEATPETLERMVGVLLARGRLDEARTLADDLLRRKVETPRLAMLREAVTALTTGALPPDAALLRAGGRSWPAIAALYRGDLDRAVALGDLQTELGTLPDALRRKVAFDATARFVEARRFAPAHDAMRMIESWTAEPEAMDELAYWRGRELELKGEGAAAATLYGRLTARPDAIGIKARYRLAGIKLDDADPAAAAAIADELQHLALNWVEPALDPRHDALLATAFRKSGRVADAIDHLRRWGKAPEASAAAVRTATGALLAGLADGSVPAPEPLRYAALSMADRLASDDEAGRAQIVAAATSLAAAGLAGRADAMLEAIEGRGATAEQIRTRFQRAALAIEGGDPQGALRVLRTMTAMVAPASPERERWVMLSARALIDAGEPAAAKHLIESEKAAAGDDDALKGALFEAAIATGDWPWVAEQMRQALPAHPARASRDDPALRDNLLGLAAALTNAGRVAEAEALGRVWGPVMAGSPEAPLFQALTTPAPENVAELQKVAATLLAAARGS